MHYDELNNTIDHLLQPSKGILAADESIGTIGKRFAAINVENNELNRCNYRLLLATSATLENYISGVILTEETLCNKDSADRTIIDLLANKGIITGVKVDKGLINLANSEHEMVTQGLDDLPTRLTHFKKLGAKFAKWRNVYLISDNTPSLNAMKAGAEILARYSACCQAVGIVPIVEPEILMDGNHHIERCAEASEMVLHELFKALFIHQVELEHIILKPSMISSGQKYQPFSTPEEIAAYTLSIFRNTVPAAVPSINFLSGGQTPMQASANLNAINNLGLQPWNLSFSYGRALQEDCLRTWGGHEANVAAAQAALIKRARLNSLACTGEYSVALEN